MPSPRSTASGKTIRSQSRSIGYAVDDCGEANVKALHLCVKTASHAICIRIEKRSARFASLKKKQRATASGKEDSRPFSPILSPRPLRSPWLPLFTPNKEVSIAGGLQRGKIGAVRGAPNPATDCILNHLPSLKKMSPRSAHATRDSPIGRGSVLF